MRLTSRAGTKVGLSDLRVPSGRARNHRIKATPGITGLSRPSVHSDGVVWHLDVGSSHPGGAVPPKGWAVRPLKRYASWVQNVVRQFENELSFSHERSMKCLLVESSATLGREQSGYLLGTPWILRYRASGENATGADNQQERPRSKDAESSQAIRRTRFRSEKIWSDPYGDVGRQRKQETSWPSHN